MIKKPLLILIITAVLLGITLFVVQEGTVTEPAIEPGEPFTPIDPQVWEALVADPDRQVEFTIVMAEYLPGDPESAVQAQMGLEILLEAMLGNGGLQEYTVYYGLNIIRARGSGEAVRSLARWPSVAEIRTGEFGLVAISGIDIFMDDNAINATGQITGTVTGPDEITPLPGIRISIYEQTGPTSWLYIGTVNTGEDGTYSISGLDTGIYRVKFDDPTGNYVTEYYNNKSQFNLATNIDVIDGATIPNIDASLAQAGQISGMITENDTGNPVADIVASAWYTATGSWHQANSDTSLSNGTYSIGSLAPGAYRVYFSDSHIPDRYLSEYYNNVLNIEDGTDVTVTAGATTTGIDAGLGSYGKMSGTVYGPDGTTPVGDIWVDVYVWDAQWEYWEWVSWDTTGASGDYEAGGFDTGDYRVEFTDSLGQLATEVYNDQPDLDSGDDVHVELGLTTPGIDASLALKEQTLSRSLAAGWNLISTLLNPTTPAPADAFASLGENYDLVWAYEGCDTSDVWKKYNPTGPPPGNDLTSIDNQHGYWLETTAEATLTITGTLPLTIDIPLCLGWNLIGFPSLDSVELTTVLAPIEGKYDLVYAYDAWDTTDHWKKYNPNLPVGNDLTHLQPWFGYWIRMTQAATLTITNR